MNLLIKKHQIYTVKILEPLEYYQYMEERFGRKWMFSLSDTYYPKILALGWCDYSRDEIVVCKVLNWQLRLAHEFGHAQGRKHDLIPKKVMHPWGIFRGWNYV